MIKQRGFVIPPFLTSPTGILATLVIVLSISNVIFFQLWTSKVEEHATYIAEVEAANAKVSEDNARRIREAESVTAEVVKGWDAAVRDLSRDYVSRLRGKDSRCSAVSGASATARLTHEATAQSGSGAGAFEATCFEIERNAAVDATQVLHLQAYIRGVCK